MNSTHLVNLLSWTMLNAMNSALLFEQTQKQRPLTQEEVEACQLKTMRCADALRDGYLDGLSAADDLDG